MPKRILVANESPTVRNVAESLLRKHSYEVSFVNRGTEALKAAKANKPDLIFLNDSLSAPDAGEICKELKQNESLRDVPVVVLLSGAGEGKEEELRHLGADAFVTDPFNPGQILEQVIRLLKDEEPTLSSSKEKGTEDSISNQSKKSDQNSAEVTASSDHQRESEDILDIVETADLIDIPDPSVRAPYENTVHGFDWFLSELRKETKREEKASPGEKKKPVFSTHRPSDEKAEHKEESKAGEVDEPGKGFEDFLEELKQEVEEPDEEKLTQTGSVLTEDVTQFESTPLVSDLREMIAERVAKEVAEMITPEFLEKIIREEMAKMQKDSF